MADQPDMEAARAAKDRAKDLYDAPVAIVRVDGELAVRVSQARRPFSKGHIGPVRLIFDPGMPPIRAYTTEAVRRGLSAAPQVTRAVVSAGLTGAANLLRRGGGSQPPGGPTAGR